MTNEVIKQLEKYCNGKENIDKVEISVLQLHRIIKALEQQTCEDAVSREDVLNLVDNLNDGSFRWASIRTKIARLHLVQPELEPCEEELDFVQEHKKISCNLIVEPCEDAISRETVCDYIAEFINNEYSTAAECDLVDAIIDGIQHLPSVNPQQRVGHWIQTQETDDAEPFILWECSECHKEFRSVVHKVSNYCPSCGCRIVEPQESEDKCSNCAKSWTDNCPRNKCWDNDYSEFIKESEVSE